MLLRDFLQRSLYGKASGYYSKSVVHRLAQQLKFRRYIGESDYRAALAAEYACKLFRTHPLVSVLLLKHPQNRALIGPYGPYREGPISPKPKPKPQGLGQPQAL